ncbi:MAG: hypothetical protein FJ271_09085 [Planctomycetes bacterium]|nr:hypothetical protein [Planctomycetota bacterium]
MANLSILWPEQGCPPVGCGVCGGGASAFDTPGARLYRAEDGLPVCRPCGHRLAPGLSALLDLADIALRIGQISGHKGTWLPLATLLEMTRVCQHYHDLANEDDGEPTSTIDEG